MRNVSYAKAISAPVFSSPFHTLAQLPELTNSIRIKVVLLYRSMILDQRLDIKGKRRTTMYEAHRSLDLLWWREILFDNVTRRDVSRIIQYVSDSVQSIQNRLSRLALRFRDKREDENDIRHA